MKPYHILECNKLEIISAGIYKFVKESTDLLESGAIGWQFLDHMKLFAAVPELVEFFYVHRLVPNSASVVILYQTGDLPLHVDELPVVAKINFPVINTNGWTNRWFSVSDEDLNTCPKTVTKFGSEVESLSALPESAFTLLTEIHDLNCPIVLNSRIPHDVINRTGESPRIIASFTFVNEPQHLLK